MLAMRVGYLGFLNSENMSMRAHEKRKSWTMSAAICQILFSFGLVEIGD
jgi:hypothetical protein